MTDLIGQLDASDLAANAQYGCGGSCSPSAKFGGSQGYSGGVPDDVFFDQNGFEMGVDKHGDPVNPNKKRGSMRVGPYKRTNLLGNPQQLRSMFDDGAIKVHTWSLAGRHNPFKPKLHKSAKRRRARR
jgi:hypothetical protein